MSIIPPRMSSSKMRQETSCVHPSCLLPLHSSTLAARELCPPQKNSAWRLGQAGNFSKILFHLYLPVFVWGFLDLLKSKTRQSPHTIQQTRQSLIMSNHDPIYTQCKDKFNNTCTTSFLQTPYEWQTAVVSTILAAHTAKTSICQLLVHPTGCGKTLFSTAIAACIIGITLCICPLRLIEFW